MASDDDLINEFNCPISIFIIGISGLKTRKKTITSKDDLLN